MGSTQIFSQEIIQKKIIVIKEDTFVYGNTKYDKINYRLQNNISNYVHKTFTPIVVNKLIRH